MIDGCIQLRNQYQLTAGQIERIDLHVHPLVLELTGKKDPRTGLEGKFSVYYSAAVAMIEGAGGEVQFSARAVRNPEAVALGKRVTATVDTSLKQQDQARVVIVLKDGRKLEKFVEHAVGAFQIHSDRDLESKFLGLADGLLSLDQSKRVMELCWSMAHTLPVGGFRAARSLQLFFRAVF